MNLNAQTKTARSARIGHGWKFGLALAACAGAGALVTQTFTACQSGGVVTTCDSTIANCNENNNQGRTSKPLARKIAVKRVDSIPGYKLTPGAQVGAFLQGKAAKLTLVNKSHLYLVQYSGGGEPVIVDLTQGDEGAGGAAGVLNSPMFSPDGKYLVVPGMLAGTKGTSYIIQARVDADSVWRVPVDTTGKPQYEPHWRQDGAGQMWVYFCDGAGTNVGKVQPDSQSLSGTTWKAPVTFDTTTGQAQVGAAVASELPGNFKAGISKDGQWALTSYPTSCLYNLTSKKLTVLVNPQQCNPSINPYPAGSKHTDYSLLLGFGGPDKYYHMVYGDYVSEGQHENLWIYNQDKKIVWKAERPVGSNGRQYYRWEKPEWSTHPLYASAIGLFDDNLETGDIVLVNIGDLSNQDESAITTADALPKPKGTFILASGDIGSSVWTHLWVAE